MISKCNVIFRIYHCLFFCFCFFAVYLLFKTSCFFHNFFHYSFFLLHLLSRFSSPVTIFSDTICFFSLCLAFIRKHSFNFNCTYLPFLHCDIHINIFSSTLWPYPFNIFSFYTTFIFSHLSIIVSIAQAPTRQINVRSASLSCISDANISIPFSMTKNYLCSSNPYGFCYCLFVLYSDPPSYVIYRHFSFLFFLLPFYFF